MVTSNEIIHRKDILKTMDYSVRKDIAPYSCDLEAEWDTVFGCCDENDYEEFAKNDEAYLCILRAFAAINARFVADMEG